MSEKKSLNLDLNLRTRAWGLSIEEDAIHLTAVHNKLNQLSYKGTDSLEGYDEAGDEEVQDFIEESQNRYGVKRGDAFMVLPRDKVMIQIAEFPREAEQNLDEVLEWQVGNYFPGGVDHLSFFPQIIARGDQLKVMIVAVPKEFLGHAFGFIRRWNLRMAGISLSTFALVNGLAKLDPKKFADDKTIVFAFTKGFLEIVGINSGKLVSSTLIEISEDDPAAMDEALNQAFSEARMDPNEIDHYLMAGSPPKHIQGYLEMEIGIPFEEWQDGEGVVVPREGLVGFGTAAGAVHEKVALDLNILPEKQRRTQKRLPLILAAVVFSIAALFFLYSEGSVYMELRAEKARLEARHQGLVTRMNEIARARGARDNIQEELNFYDPYRQDYMILELMRSLTDKMPDGTYLTNLTIKKGNDLQIQGESDKPFEVQRLLTTIPYLKDVKPTNAITRGKEKRRFVYRAVIDLEKYREEV